MLSPAFVLAVSLSVPDSAWIDTILQVPRPEPGVDAPVLEVLLQDCERLERNRSVIRAPLRIGNGAFERGLGAHSVGRVRIRSPKPIERIDLEERRSSELIVYRRLKRRDG